MTELEIMIRKAVHERVDRAPMPQSIESIDALDRRGLRTTGRHPRRGVLVGAALVALVALLAGALVTARLTRDPSEVSVGSTLPPPAKPATPLAGRSLPARYGLPDGVPGYHFLTMELDRPVGLDADDVAYLPTGPLGPMYAQSIRVDYDPAAFTLPDQDGIAVLTVLPEEQAAVLAAASGNGPTHPATVGGRQVIVAEPWSATGDRMTDDRAVTWVQDGAAIIVTGSPSVTEQQLLAAAADVVPIPTIPLLPPVAPDAKESGVLPASYSLTPRNRAPDANQPFEDGTPWPALIYGEPLSAAMGTFVDHGTEAGTNYTLRELGDPASNRVLHGSWGFASASGATPFGPLWFALNVNEAIPKVPNHFPVSGSAPDSIASVELTLDDGTKVDGQTHDAGLGWPSVLFLMFVPDERQVVHVDARSSDGTLIYTRDLDEMDGSYPGRAHGVYISDYSFCGEPDPTFPTLDC